VSNEFIASYFPLRIERYETISDSSGGGLHRAAATASASRIAFSATAAGANPLKRDPELVRADVARRLVSTEGARRYGVVIGNDGTQCTAHTRKTESVHSFSSLSKT